MEAGGGLWVREYRFTNMVILNAQLQSLVSVSRYAETSGDLDGKVIAGKLELASRALLSRFDTGCWSLYSLDGGTRALPPLPHFTPQAAGRNDRRAPVAGGGGTLGAGLLGRREAGAVAVGQLAVARYTRPPWPSPSST